MKLICIAAALTLSLGAQESNTFAVATIKPSKLLEQNSGIHNSRGGLQASNTPLIELIRFALGVQDFQVTGGPAWIRDARFDVNASNDKPEEELKGPIDIKIMEAHIARMRSRLLHLLQDRFQLQLRDEQREVPIYGLTVDKGGLRLKAAPEPLGNVNTNNGGGVGSISGKGMTMPRLCTVLSDLLERPVADETGVSGAYDVELKYSLDDSVPDAAAPSKLAQTFPSMFTAVKEQLGLRLTSKKGMATMWIVVRAEKPTEN